MKKVEKLKQTLMSNKDFSMLEIFRHIDKYAHGNVNPDNLRVFFKNYAFCADLEEEDVLNWIRRYDRDVDLKLDFSDFVTSLGPYCQYTQKAENIDLSPKKDEEMEESEMTQEQIAEQQLAPAVIIQKGKAGSQKMLKSGRPMSKATKTTAASINQRFGEPSTFRNSNKGYQARSTKERENRFQSHSAVAHSVKPRSVNEQTKVFQTAGEILNYPYSFDNVTNQESMALDNRLAKQRYEEQYRVAEIQNEQLYSPVREEFKGSLELAKALYDMCEIEGELEKKRRELVLRSDFNLCDVFKMFGGLSRGKQGVDCDDLYSTIIENLELTITKDEVFIMFYKLDKDGDGLISYEEMSNCYMPRAHEYAVLIQSRGGFYGGESNFKKYFEGPTRDLLKKFIKGFVDCEVSIEHVRQRICNKIKINNFTAFAAIDEMQKGTITVDDFRVFMKKANLYPIEKDLQLLYERFDKDGDKSVTFEEFVAAVTPFMNNE